MKPADPPGWYATPRISNRVLVTESTKLEPETLSGLRAAAVETSASGASRDFYIE
jgi:hypothetical protein